MVRGGPASRTWAPGVVTESSGTWTWWGERWGCPWRSRRGAPQLGVWQSSAATPPGSEGPCIRDLSRLKAQSRAGLKKVPGVHSHSTAQPSGTRRLCPQHPSTPLASECSLGSPGSSVSALTHPNTWAAGRRAIRAPITLFPHAPGTLLLSELTTGETEAAGTNSWAPGSTAPGSTAPQTTDSMALAGE